MRFSRTKNTLRNIAFGSLNRVINIVLPFIARTVILYIMGTQYLGLSSLFASILSFLSLTELGIGAAMVMIVLGANETENGNISVRHRKQGDLGAMSIEQFLADVKKLDENKEND